MSYIDNTLNYLKSTLDSIKSAVLNTKDVLTALGNILGTIAEVLGFIGFRVFILLMTTAFVLWLLNLVSPVSRRTNYIIAVGLVLWLAITAKMPIQIVILKYVLIIISPFIITAVANFFVKKSSKIATIIINKLKIIYLKINFKFFKNKIYEIANGDNFALVFTSDLPTIDDIKNSKIFLEFLNYKLMIFESEKISLVDDNKRIIFSNDLKISQLVESLQSSDIKILWFWSEFYGVDRLINELYNLKSMGQNKVIIGSGENSFILNFLQEKWNWKVIYGKNFKTFMQYCNLNKIFDKEIVQKILKNETYELSIINDYNIDKNYFVKEKIVGSDLSVLVDSIGTKNKLTFKNKILFLDGKYDSRVIFYRSLNHLKNYMLDNNICPKSIIFGNILLKDGLSIAGIINDFNMTLKNNNINIPIFKIKNFDFLELGGQCIIEYKDNNIYLTSIKK